MEGDVKILWWRQNDAEQVSRRVILPNSTSVTMLNSTSRRFSSRSFMAHFISSPKNSHETVVYQRKDYFISFNVTYLKKKLIKRISYSRETSIEYLVLGGQQQADITYTKFQHIIKYSTFILIGQIKPKKNIYSVFQKLWAKHFYWFNGWVFTLVNARQFWFINIQEKKELIQPAIAFTRSSLV